VAVDRYKYACSMFVLEMNQDSADLPGIIYLPVYTRSIIA